MKSDVHFFIYRYIPLRTKNISHKICRRNPNRHFMFNKLIFFPKTMSFMRQYGVKKYCSYTQATDVNILWRMRIAWRITNGRDTHSEYVTLIAFLQ